MAAPDRTLLQSLDAEPSPALLLDTEGHVMWANRAWDAAATRDGAAPSCFSQALLYRPWLDAIHGELRAYYAGLLQAMLAPTDSGRPAGVRVHLSECNTPERIRRSLTRFIPLGRRHAPTCLLVLHQLLEPGLAPEDVDLAPPETYRDLAGRLVQCGCCRRVRTPDGARWRFVPALVRDPDASTQQSVCTACLTRYYGLPEVEGASPRPP